MKRIFWLRKTHKWLALFAGIQVLIWSVSGLYMTFVDLDIIHGDHLVSMQKPQVIDSSSILPISKKIIDENKPIHSIKLKAYFDRPVYEIRAKELLVIVDALTGEKKNNLSKSDIQQNTQQIYAGEASISAIELLNQYPTEIGGRKQSVWQVKFDDWSNSTLYFHPKSGRLISKRTDLWRTFDFLWLLHIMEMWDSEGYSGLLFRLFSIASLLMTLFGSWLLFYRLQGSEVGGDKSSGNKIA